MAVWKARIFIGPHMGQQSIFEVQMAMDEELAPVNTKKRIYHVNTNPVTIKSIPTAPLVTEALPSLLTT